MSKKQRKRSQLWLNDMSCVRLRPVHKDFVWSGDFMQGRTHNGRSFRILTAIDVCARECLAINVARSLKSDNVLVRLACMMETRGLPGHIRSDNGAEFRPRRCVPGLRWSA